jgi:signal transduction histidine kinase
MPSAAAVQGRLRHVVADARAVDAALAAVLTVLAQVQVAASTPWWVRLLMVMVTAPLAGRRRAPLAVTAVVAAAVSLMGFADDPPSVFGAYLAVMLAAFTVAERCRLEPAAAGGLLLLGGIVGHDWHSPEFGGLSGIVSDSTVPAVIWLVGRAVHVQRDRAERARELLRQLERERGQLAQLAVASERARLARELHDVVTHSVSVVVIQAQGARRSLDGDHPEVAGALEAIESAGRSALTEMRGMLGVLRDQEPAARAYQPGLADVPSLLAQVRSAGLPVTLSASGTARELDPDLDLDAYRIVQEALTNTLKYAAGAKATVDIAWTPHAVELSVRDSGGDRLHGEGEGRGLAGMRERVHTHGGDLRTEPAPGGGFEVWCRMPVKETT